jgi:hypothetical protein
VVTRLQPTDMLAVIRALPRGSAAITRNLPGRLRAALQRLKADKSIVILDTDKNLGLVADDTVSYIQHCEDELARTHTRLPWSSSSATTSVFLAALCDSSSSGLLQVSLAHAKPRIFT